MEERGRRSSEEWEMRTERESRRRGRQRGRDMMKRRRRSMNVQRSLPIRRSRRKVISAPPFSMIGKERISFRSVPRPRLFSLSNRQEITKSAIISLALSSTSPSTSLVLSRLLSDRISSTAMARTESTASIESISWMEKVCFPSVILFSLSASWSSHMAIWVHI